ncbi:hypothetical protein [Tautonia sociabilis]|uniref:Uncharacterized protein n=1 Tax=Tautonia sociabilis TaxID=2080755 RepID=A0A432MDW7_9BACT|nr:hypothetical protein [Tautonia sociabilis]RUL83190.1 hypothetical protein TsocGM_22605 [Tautonia sociabilis]
MDRRTALFSTVMLGSLLARGVRGQDRGRFRPARATLDEPRLNPELSIGTDPLGADLGRPSEALPPASDPSEDIPFVPPAQIKQDGLGWGIFNISPYTALPHSRETAKPESAIVEWIFRHTGSEIWHGEDLAVLSVTPKQLRAFHRDEVIAKVNEVYRRFVDAWFDILTLRVRIVSAVDPKWRYDIASKLESIRLGSGTGRGGPQGQHAWLLDPSDTERLMATMTISQAFRLVEERKEPIVNGQTLVLRTGLKDPVTYRGGLDRSNQVALGFEPTVDSVEEGVELRASPLLRGDGTSVDLAVDLKATSVRRKIVTRVIVPRQIGPAEMDLDVPEVSHTRLNQTIPDWPLDRSLILSAGILPGIFMNKGGPLNLGFGGPGQTELLVVLDLQSNLESARRRRPRDRE